MTFINKHGEVTLQDIVRFIEERVSVALGRRLTAGARLMLASQADQHVNPVAFSRK